jgi:hypothetical protein
VHSPAGRTPPMQDPTYCQMKSNLPTPDAVAVQPNAAGRSVCAARALRYSFCMSRAAVYTTSSPFPPRPVVGQRP